MHILPMALSLAFMIFMAFITTFAFLVATVYLFASYDDSFPQSCR
ncbi:MAG: hypothetical protein ETSY1_28960 [Candidatus Entotheonella factor]|uniref:Uncharacterized protein n=1 Tax=Entotheonella factor TaxID=1429438 RepID=W4LD38_ENTF1|nr:MAG: hypothetical protein ETSY1_28960 [Candidatus Entotheonella factor]